MADREVNVLLTLKEGGDFSKLIDTAKDRIEKLSKVQETMYRPEVMRAIEKELELFRVKEQFELKYQGMRRLVQHQAQYGQLGGAVVNVFDRMAKGMERFSQTLSRYVPSPMGLAIGGVGIMSAAAAAGPTSVSTLRDSTMLAVGEIGLMFTPAIIRLSRTMQDAAKWVRGWDESTKQLVVSATIWIVTAAAVGFGLKMLVAAATTATTIITGLAGAVAFLGRSSAVAALVAGGSSLAAAGGAAAGMTAGAALGVGAVVLAPFVLAGLLAYLDVKFTPEHIQRQRQEQWRQDIKDHGPLAVFAPMGRTIRDAVSPAWKPFASMFPGGSAVGSASQVAGGEAGATQGWALRSGNHVLGSVLDSIANPLLAAFAPIMSAVGVGGPKTAISTGFQAQQIDIFGMHDYIQNQAVRDEMQQQQIDLQMRELEATVRAADAGERLLDFFNNQFRLGGA